MCDAVTRTQAAPWIAPSFEQSGAEQSRAEGPETGYPAVPAVGSGLLFACNVRKQLEPRRVLFHLPWIVLFL